MVALICVLSGTALRFLLQDSPIRVLFWSEKWMRPILGCFGTTWESYANSTQVDHFLMLFSTFCAVFLMAIAAWILYRQQIGIRLTIALSVLFIVFALLSWKDHFYHVPFLMELAILCATPYFFYADAQQSSTKLVAKFAIALTFVGHGLYALNVFEIPGDFVQMVMNITAINEDAAKLALKVIGVFDLVAGMLLFLPSGRMAQIALLYCIIWGFLTAFARIVGHYHVEFGIHTLDEYWHETLIRLPNGLVPLFLFLSFRKDKSPLHS